MADRPDAAQLVRTAEQAMPIEIRNPRDARLITAALLRELAGHLGPNDRPDHGCYWSPSALRDLADRIDLDGPDVHETTYLILREDFGMWLVTASNPAAAVEQFRRDRPGDRHRGVFEERLHAEEGKA